MRKLLFIVAFLSAAAQAPATAEEPQPPMAKGVAAYQSKNYAEAATAFEEQLESHGANAAVLYNLGNARYRLAEYGPAIHAYEQALILDPRAADIRANLGLARKAAAAYDENHRPDRRQSPIYWMRWNEWAITGAVALGVFALASLVRGLGFLGLSRNAIRWLFAAPAVIFFASIAALAIRHSELDRAIVVAPNAKVRLSPFETADVVATLSAGRAVRAEKEHGGFFLTANGWISQRDVKKVFDRRDQ